MKITGLITEYNPFHNGHLHHLKMARLLTEAEGVVAVMSGDFTQRGYPAIVDKYARTRMALSAGVDAVLELPVYHALGSAERFARGAVDLLSALGAVDTIVYGCEGIEEMGDEARSGNISRAHTEAMRRTAYILANEPAPYKEHLGEALRDGASFPAARARAVSGLCPEAETLLRYPNNTLALEYEKAILMSGSHISGLGIVRSDSGYLESGSEIRRAIRELDSPGELSGLMPMDSALELTYHMDIDMFSDIMNYRLLIAGRDEMTGYEDISPDIAARMLRLRDRGYSLTEMTDHLTTRNITGTRARRALMHLLLGIKHRESSAYALPYIRVLGFRRDSRVMKALKDSSRLPLVTKLADAPDPGWEEDDRAARIYNQILTGQFGVSLQDDYRHGPVIL